MGLPFTRSPLFNAHDFRVLGARKAHVHPLYANASAALFNLFEITVQQHSNNRVKSDEPLPIKATFLVYSSLGFGPSD